ncbi:hypothetical protein [Blastopirellula marina]|uniref:Carboxypeptidase regulatory-like domain-containing protein n=1 Tax=Blastopirellula marina TaxID=124 RepID=A0A2S8F6Y2_9BACT|nr:hypothetical protein [Blastopirellula marina]PQO27898.1 hypothetical protein C5Y98_26600 [Blastopirellula marina]PTL41634.1 hypothetical protein C5Y97_26615 [Blastopirellula marina]
MSITAALAQTFSKATRRAGIGLMIATCLLSGTATAQRPKPMLPRPGKPDINVKITQPKIVRVVTDKNQPLAEAEVRVGWWEDAEGDLLLQAILNPPKTNAQGEVLIEVPQGAVRAQISAVAPGYAAAGTQYSLSGEPKIVLSPGQIIRVKAVDADNKPIEKAIPLLERSQVWPHEFQPEEGLPGVYVSPVVDPQRRWMRVVDANGEGPTRYSDLIDVRNPPAFDEQGNILATLRPGIRLEGRLDATVPRPVTGGCVELFILEGESHRIEPKCWTWQDTAAVQPDGTFTFESLPRGGHVQLVAVVDGYQSKRPTAESLSTYLFDHNAGELELITKMVERNDAYWPQLFPLPAEQDKVEIELACVPTGTAQIKVVDALGQPMPAATVNLNPNGYFLGGELFIPGTESFTEAARLGENPQQLADIRAWTSETFLSVKTNDEGIALVRCLAGDTRHTFEVTADGYQLPVYPASSKDFPSRYATLEVKSGETTVRTVTLERTRASGPRELTVLDGQGRPLPGITLVVTDVALAGAEEDWNLWSLARLGEVIEAKSDEGGRIQITTPLELDGQPITRLRLFLKGGVGRNASVFGKRLDVPVTDDGRVIVLTVSDEPPRSEHALREVTARYVRPEEAFPRSPRQLLDQLVEQPSVVVLKQLLAASNFSGAMPLELEPRSSSLDLNDPAPVAVVETEQGKRVVVLCRVQPAGAPANAARSISRMPEAAFVFDAADASFQGIVGGHVSAKGHPCSLHLTDLGPKGDYFFKVSWSEENGSFSQVEQWTLVGQLDSPALTFFCQQRDPAWSAESYQVKVLAAEFGYLEFRGTARQLPRDEPGWIDSGVKVPRKIYWDGTRNKFSGLSSMWIESDPAYEVDVKRSSAFVPLKVSPSDLVAGGGRRSFENWHAWDVAVPPGNPAQLQLLLVQPKANGDEEVVKELADWPLPSGMHFVQLQVRNGKDSATLEVRPFAVEGAIEQQFTVPRILFSENAAVPAAAVLRASPKQLDLLRRTTEDDGVSLVWRLIQP